MRSPGPGQAQAALEAHWQAPGSWITGVTRTPPQRRLGFNGIFLRPVFLYGQLLLYHGPTPLKKETDMAPR